MQPIIILPLEKATQRLQEILSLPIDDVVRDATVQRFEYTFELGVKLIKRFLKEVYNLDEDFYLDMLKSAVKYELISNIELWKEFKIARNYTSHNYSENGANYSYNQAALFFPEIQKTILKMQELNQKIQNG